MKCIKILIIVGVIAIIGSYFYILMKNDFPMKDIYDGTLVIAKNGEILEYNLNNGEYRTVEINEHPEEGYKRYVFEGLDYREDTLFVRNPQFIQIVDKDLTNVDKLMLEESNYNSPYIGSMTMYNDKVYYISNSHVKDGNAVSCEYYDNEYNCYDNVISHKVFNYDNKLYTILEKDYSPDGYNFIEILIRDQEQSIKKVFDIEEKITRITSSYIYNDYLYVNAEFDDETDLENINDKKYLFKIKLDFSEYEVLEVDIYSYNIHAYNDSLYLYRTYDGEPAEITVIDLNTFTIKESYKTKELKSSCKYEYRENLLFNYGYGSLKIYDMEKKEFLYNGKLDLPKDYREAYDFGSVTIINNN